jgi:hypothetical protein
MRAILLGAFAKFRKVTISFCNFNQQTHKIVKTIIFLKTLNPYMFRMLLAYQQRVQ